MSLFIEMELGKSVDLQARMALTVATVNGLSSKIIDTETLTNHCNKCKATTNGN